MSPSTDNDLALRFYDTVIRDYICGDLRWFLQNETPTLGPFLASVSSGIDASGGSLYGFENGSMRRSVRFLTEIMKFDDAKSKAIYSFARCGYLHEGIGKLAFSWFADYKRIKKGEVIFLRSDGGVALNIAELARLFIDASEDLRKNGQGQIRHLPRPSSGDKSLIEQLSAANLPKIDEILDWYDNEIDEIRGSHSFQDILNEVRYFSFDGYRHIDDGLS